jgi:hypothetical protein
MVVEIVLGLPKLREMSMTSCDLIKVGNIFMKGEALYEIRAMMNGETALY